MDNGTWTEALSELVSGVREAFLRFLKQDIVQVGLTVGMFFALAVPLLLVILFLWWIDSTGWRPSGGFYKIGHAAESVDTKPGAHAAHGMVTMAVPAMRSAGFSVKVPLSEDSGAIGYQSDAPCELKLV